MSGRMRVLMLCHRPPYPPMKGEKIRAFHHLRALAPGHQVTLATLVDEPRDMDDLPRLRSLADVHAVQLDGRSSRLRALTALLSRDSLTVRYFRSAAFRRLLDKLLAERSYDIVLVYSSAMAQYVEGIDGIPVVLDLVDMDSQKYLQYADHARFPLSALYRVEGRRLRAWEAHAGRRASANLFVSAAEAALFGLVAPGAPAMVLPMVVDTEYFTPQPEPANPTPPVLVFTGVMDYRPNVDAVLYFVHEILPRIRVEVPDTRFLVVGQRPAPAVRRLAHVPGVEVTGRVPDVRPFLRRAQVSIAPFRIAQGVQTKVLEAMAMERPVVLTPAAHRGLPVQPDRHVLLADGPVDFASAVIRLLRDPALRRHVGIEARRFVDRHHSVAETGDRLVDILERVRLRTWSSRPISVGDQA